MARRVKNKTEQAIFELKTVLKDLIEDGGDAYYLDDDLYLLRWLKAKNMDVKKAEKALRENVKWRKDIKMLDILKKDFHPDISREFHLEKGRLKDGSPVGMINAGIVDLRGIQEKFGQDALYEYCIKHALDGERDNVMFNRQKFAETDGEIREDSLYGSGFFFDLKDMAFKQLFCIKNISLAIRMASDYMKYFANLGSLNICINCPKGSAKVINLLSKIIQSPDLTIEIYDTNMAKWKEALLRRVDADELPTIFGGNRVVKGLIPPHSYNA